MTQPTHYLRVEGVNLSAFVFDTRDLSTNRGGSLMLLNAVDTALEAAATVTRVLSKGASSGLFEIATTEPAAVVGQVREVLADKYPDTTFVIDMAPVTDTFRADAESLIAANRWRQMQASSLAVPPENRSVNWSQPACDLDGLRPAGSLTMPLSESTHRRRKHGRREKKEFYRKMTGLDGLPTFADDFAEISKDCVPLGGKLAVFYADGNGFGGIQAKHCDTPDKQIAWDTSIRESRESFLRAFLETEIGAKPEWLTAAGTARFETLLWGGDELMFVMPAALGWRFATCFFQHLGGRNLRDAMPEFPSIPLTHAAALVFCQDHAPIHRIKRLAKDQMAEFAKETDRNRDSLVTVALESFDHLGTSYQDSMRKRYGNAAPLASMIHSAPDGGSLGGHLPAVAAGFDSLRASPDFARSQLRSLVGLLVKAEDSASARALAAFESESPPAAFRNADDKTKKLLHAILLPLFHNQPAILWLQLEELWDYALP